MTADDPTASPTNLLLIIQAPCFKGAYKPGPVFTKCRGGVPYTILLRFRYESIIILLCHYSKQQPTGRRRHHSMMTLFNNVNIHDIHCENIYKNI